MAYYSGSASNYTDLLNALTTACASNGWTWADGILNKGTTYIKPYVSTSVINTLGPGLVIQGGTGKSGSTLLNPSPMQARIGDIGVAPVTLPVPTFPMAYNLFVFSSPDEVFLIGKYDIDRYVFLAFGGSTISGVKAWFTASNSAGYFTSTSTGQTQYKCFAATTTTGAVTGNDGNTAQGFSTGPFWQTTRFLQQHFKNIGVWVDLDSIGWVPDLTEDYSCDANATIQPLYSRLPSAWSANSALLPIQVIWKRAESKRSIITDIVNARYVRIDNYEPEQVFTLGSDKWKVFPFHKKNLGTRDGGNTDHSGTLGWCIKYDGP